jgi:hypothetical protein
MRVAASVSEAERLQKLFEQHLAGMGLAAGASVGDRRRASFSEW